MQFDLFDGFIDGILIFDESQKVVYLNGSAVSFLQLRSPKELLEKQITEEFPEFKPMGLNRPPDDIVYSEITLPSRHGLQDLVIMAGMKKIPNSKHTLFYLRDVTTEVILHRKFMRERKEREKAVIEAETDPLTGCLNKAAFNDRLATQFSLLKKVHGEMCLMVLDLDGFKQINDTHGHQAGDLFLKKIAETIKNCLRMPDILGRFGGDEFVIMIKACPLEDSIIVGRRILQRVREYKLIFNEHTLSVTASIGICGFSKELESIEKFFEYADQSAYRAKKSGKDAMCLHPNRGPLS